MRKSSLSAFSEVMPRFVTCIVLSRNSEAILQKAPNHSRINQERRELSVALTSTCHSLM